MNAALQQNLSAEELLAELYRPWTGCCNDGDEFLIVVRHTTYICTEKCIFLHAESHPEYSRGCKILQNDHPEYQKK